MHPVLNDTCTGFYFNAQHIIAGRGKSLNRRCFRKALKPVALSVSCPVLSVVETENSNPRMFTVKLTAEQYQEHRMNGLPDMVMVEGELYGSFMCNLVQVD